MTNKVRFNAWVIEIFKSHKMKRHRRKVSSWKFYWCVIFSLCSDKLSVLGVSGWNQPLADHRVLKDCRERIWSHLGRGTEEVQRDYGCSFDFLIIQVFTPISDSWFLLERLIRFTLHLEPNMGLETVTLRLKE